MATKERVAVDLNSAIALFQSGKIDEAQSLFKKITKSKRAPALAWFVSAIIHTQKNEIKFAIDAFKKAISQQPNYPDAHNNLGVLLEMNGDFSGACKHYQLASKQKSNYANAQFNLANIKHQMGDYSSAEDYYLKALKSDPQYLKAMNNLGLLHQQLKKYDSAVQYFEKALGLNPNDFEVLNNIAYVYHLRSDYPRAIQYYQQSIALNENNAETLNNLGITLQAMQQFDESENAFKKALYLKNNYYEAQTNLANLYKESGKTKLAEEYYQKSIETNPEYAPAHNNYGLLNYRQGNYDKAHDHYERAISADGNYSEAVYNLGAFQLSSGEFTSGWKNYLARPTPRHEWAINTRSIVKNDLLNKKVLLLKDQGIGDEIFFLRFADQLTEIASEINYLSTTKILPFTTEIKSLNHVTDDESKINDYDFSISVADLPSLLVEDNNNTPASVALTPDLSLTEELREKLSQFGPPPYIGITWRAGQQAKDLLFKSVPIEQLLKALSPIKATFIVLQRQPTNSELQVLKSNSNFANIGDLSQLNEDLPRMLSLLSLLDDYVGVSNTNMHLRAAVGKTAQVLVPHPPEWRWMMTGEKSVWFPDFNVFRQSPDNDWQLALNDLSKTLQEKYDGSN